MNNLILVDYGLDLLFKF